MLKERRVTAELTQSQSERKTEQEAVALDKQENQTKPAGEKNYFVVLREKQLKYDQTGHLRRQK